MKSQQLERNGKNYRFFPDITIGDMTKGFLVDETSALIGYVQELWDEFCLKCEITEQCFGAYLYTAIHPPELHPIVFNTYCSIPTSDVVVVGRGVPSYSKVIKKKRTSVS